MTDDDPLGLDTFEALEFALSLPTDPWELINLGHNATLNERWKKGHWALYAGALAAALSTALNQLEKP